MVRTVASSSQELDHHEPAVAVAGGLRDTFALAAGAGGA
jgi:hypothetical protein